MPIAIDSPAPVAMPCGVPNDGYGPCRRRILRQWELQTRTPLAAPNCAAMANEPEARFHFSVWRPARIDRTYLHITGSGNGPERTADGSAVLEQLYAWDPGPHDFALSSSPAAVVRINDRLFRPFGEHHPPNERRVRRFLNAVTAA